VRQVADLDRDLDHDREGDRDCHHDWKPGLSF
jgi:hypothetical protein